MHLFNKNFILKLKFLDEVLNHNFLNEIFDHDFTINSIISPIYLLAFFLWPTRPVYENVCQPLTHVYNFNFRFANLTAETISSSTLSPDNANKYWDMMAYNNAKLCNVLFAQELAQRWQQKGISVFSLHPGNMVYSNISRNWWLYRLLFAIVRPFTKSLVCMLSFL